MICRDGKVRYSASSLIFFFIFFSFIFYFFPFFLLTIARSGRLAEIRWSVCISNCAYIHYYYYYYYYYYYLLIRVFHISVSWWSFTVFWMTVSRILLCSLAILNNAVIWKVSTRPPTSKSPSSFNNPFVTEPKAPITIGIIVICMFQRFFNSQARSRYLSFFSHSFSFILWSAGTAKSTILQVLFFLLIVIRSGIIIIIIYSIEFFTSSLVDGLSLFWMTASLLKSPGFFSVFWPFSIML